MIPAATSPGPSPSCTVYVAVVAPLDSSTTLPTPNVPAPSDHCSRVARAVTWTGYVPGCVAEVEDEKADLAGHRGGGGEAAGRAEGRLDLVGVGGEGREECALVEGQGPVAGEPDAGGARRADHREEALLQRAGGGVARQRAARLRRGVPGRRGRDLRQDGVHGVHQLAHLARDGGAVDGGAHGDAVLDLGDGERQALDDVGEGVRRRRDRVGRGGVRADLDGRVGALGQLVHAREAVEAVEAELRGLAGGGGRHLEPVLAGGGLDGGRDDALAGGVDRPDDLAERAPADVDAGGGAVGRRQRQRPAGDDVARAADGARGDQGVRRGDAGDVEGEGSGRGAGGGGRHAGRARGDGRRRTRSRSWRACRPASRHCSSRSRACRGRPRRSAASSAAV